MSGLYLPSKYRLLRRVFASWPPAARLGAEVGTLVASWTSLQRDSALPGYEIVLAKQFRLGEAFTTCNPD